MGVVEIPPYVLAGEPPPNARRWEREFHTRSYLIAPPIDFPRAIFADALAEHARLLEQHADAILTAPLESTRAGCDGGDDDAYMWRTIDGIERTCTLLASDGAGVELHKWRAQDLSFVVQRCRGIVRKLMETPADGTTYVIVVARGVASLHLLRGVAPKRAGDRERLEVAERDLVVEPWEQWHRRRGYAVVTWWRTPLGELAASRVVRRPLCTPDDVVDAVVALYEPSIRRGVAAYEREHQKRRGLAIVTTTRGGDDLYFVDRFEGDAWVDGFDDVVRAAEKHHPGFQPVIVDAYDFAGVRWLPTGDARDLAKPEGLVRTREGWPPKPRPSAAKPEARTALGRCLEVLIPGDLFFIGSAYCFALGAAVGALRLVRPLASERHELVATLLALVLLPASLVLLVAGLRARRAIRARVYDEPLPVRRPRPPKLDSAFWMNKLSDRLARLARLEKINAPETIIELENRLIQKAVAELSPRDALAVMRASRHIAESEEAEGAGSAAPEEKPN